MSGSAATDSAALRLPTSPYPGLRPFLDHEEMLMSGRQTQVEEIVARLGQPRQMSAGGADAPLNEAPATTRFVAVIGGSGSGKSSLIRAGVVPYLRQYGIPEAGDLWEIVVATPGTNFQPDADGQVHESPITRLARKFERVLRGAHDASRCEAIAQTLRRPGGLGQMVEVFGRELDLPEALQPEAACLLVVIDQFEELFHKSNAGSADAKQLVERVIDHYHQARAGQGHGKCYLAITMRSEHLNDCAGYLGLPEAINAGSYLVSRLDDAQVREVIDRPAQRFLRLRQRERQVLLRAAPSTDQATLPTLPRSVHFDPMVIERLTADARRIANDPDHLPLLQHALARTWASACARHGLDESGVPDDITLADLWRAAQATTDTPVADDQNVLQLSLDRWAEFVLDSHGADERQTVLDLLRRLAYKDTRTGTYNQQRLYVAAHPLGAQRLRALLDGRWIDGVDYLFWDDEDQQRVTLKVSHESFIRGWKTLRKLADQEAERLEQYIELLSATRSWLAHDRQDRDLLEGRLLARLDDARIEDAIGPIAAEHDTDPETAIWHDWHGWLAQIPRGVPLQDVARLDVRQCVRQSRELLDQREREAREQRDNEIKALAEADKARAEAAAAKARADTADALVRTEQAEARTAKMRQLGRLRIGGLILIGTSLIAAFAGLVLVPVTIRAQHYFQAAGLANEVVPSLAQEQIGGSLPDLGKLIRAAEQIDLANKPSSTHEPWTAMTASMADNILSLPLLRQLNLASLLSDAAAAIEPMVNRQLRQVLTQSLWLAKAGDAGAEAMFPGNRTLTLDCSGEPGDQAPDEQALKGQVTVEGGRWADARVRRGIFVAEGNSVGREVFAATVRSGDSELGCTLGNRVYVLPQSADARAQPAALVFDANLNYMIVTAAAERDERSRSGSGAETVQVLRLRWNERNTTTSKASLSGPLAVLTSDPQASDNLRQQAQADSLSQKPADANWYTAGGRGLRVGTQAWQLVSASEQPLLPAPTGLAALEPAPAGSYCLKITTKIRSEFDAYVKKNRQTGEGPEQLDIVTLSSAGHCLLLQRTHLHSPDASAGDPSSPLRDQISLQVFRLPVAADHDADGRLLNTNLLANVDFGRVRHDDKRWRTGAHGSDREGWLVLEREASDETPVRYLGLPWSTAALARLANGLRQSHCAAWLAREKTANRPAECAPDWPVKHAATDKGE